MAFDPQRLSRVRELCRQLKPIIGPQADQILRAYALEDEEGKKAVEDHLQLLAARYLWKQLDSEAGDLVPPESQQADGAYRLGKILYNNRQMGSFGLREDEWVQHLGIFGRSGAGKTNAGFLIVNRLLEKNKPVLIFDWKRNYRDLLKLPGMDNMAVYTVGRDVVPFSFNPLIPPAGTHPKTWLKKLIAVISHAYLLGDGVAYLLQEALDAVYQQAGLYDGSIQQWPTFQHVLNYLKRRDSPGREAGWMSSALRALASLGFGEMGKLLAGNQDQLKNLLQRPAVLELDALAQSDKVFLVEALLLWVHHYRMSQPEREQFKHAIVIEEAHHILSNQRQSLLGGQNVMELTFREIREFGESLVILDQHPSQIAMTALGNTYCTLCFNLKHRTDVAAMAQAMLLKEDQKDILGELPIGQAVVRLQGRVTRPFLIGVPQVKLTKGAVSDRDILQHMARLGLHSTNQQQSITASPAAGADNQHRKEDCPEDFLRDIADYPDSGIAERYKRLGLSVRQGQKLKAALIEKSLITESLERCRSGSKRVIRLTEQGRLWLPDADPSGTAGSCPGRDESQASSEANS